MSCLSFLTKSRSTSTTVRRSSRPCCVPLCSNGTQNGDFVRRTLHLLVVLGLVGVLTQGFQCASSDVSAAKKAMQQRDYVKAKMSLEKAIATNPEDCEALILLGEVNQGLNDAAAMVAAYKKASACKGLTPAQKDQISLKLYNAWVASYNGGITKFNDYVASKADSDLAEAAVYLAQAEQIKPIYSDPIALLGLVRENQSDTNSAVSAYKRWYAIERPGFDIIILKNITIGQQREGILKALGTPLETKTDSLQGDAVIYKDRFEVGSRSLYLFSAMEKGQADAVLEGWTFNPSEDISEAERWRLRTSSITPLKSLAFIEYQHGNKQAAFDYATTAIKLKPTDTEVVPLRTQLLQELGRTDEAMHEIESRLKTAPSDFMLRLQYASLLAGIGREEESLREYKNVLAADPSNETALYNLAAHYKNVAGNKQRTELEKMDADPNYKPDMSYMDDLAVAAGYFEKLRVSPKYTSDIVVLEQLANIYEVRKETAKVKALIMELEALEGLNLNNKEYYRIMEGLYGRNKMIDKMKHATEKGAKL